MESVQALLAAQAADAIVGFLHRVHRQDRTALPVVQMKYEDNEDFNNFVDEANRPVRIFDIPYRASEVLFTVDHQAYRDLLSNYDPSSVDDEGTAETSGDAP